MSEKKLEKQNIEPETANEKQNFFSRLINKYKERKTKKLQQIENQKLSEEENKKVEEKLEEANQEIQRSNTKNKKVRNIIFFIFNIVLVAGILIWNIFTTDDFSPLNLLNTKPINFLYVLLLLAAIILLDVLSVHRMIYRKTLRSRWNTSYKSLGILRYYDAVTVYGHILDRSRCSCIHSAFHPNRQTAFSKRNVDCYNFCLPYHFLYKRNVCLCVCRKHYRLHFRLFGGFLHFVHKFFKKIQQKTYHLGFKIAAKN